MGGDSSETRNLIFAGVLSMAVILGWYALFPPEPPAPPADRTVAEGVAGQGVTPGVAGGADAAAGLPNLSRTREAALTLADRVVIDSDALSGSLSLKGGRIDDLHLDKYKETLDPGSDTVTLLNPTGGPTPYYVVYGWLPVQGHTAGPVPDANTDWSLAEGERLTPQTPVTLRWDNGQGLIFTRRISVDERYMFTIAQSVENTTAAPVSLAPYGYVARRGKPQVGALFILHEGAVGTFDGSLSELDYDDMEDLPVNSLEGGRAQATPVAANGWVGFTDKYWMTVLAPQSGQSFDAIHKLIQRPGGVDEYRTETRLPVTTVAAGATAQIETRLFAGAKEVQTIRDYMDNLGIDRFDDAVDWGWFYFLTKPIYTLLHTIGGLVGNMGWAIIGLTLLVKLILLPLAYKSYVSMSKMKALQPQMEKIKERCGDDKQKLQQAMIELYKKEKVNPASGCLPILLQIPIFFSLYKVLYVTIEMRHAPFIGWIRDLSAPDPSTWLTLFGAVPWEVPAFLSIISIGVFPILMGITMWLQQKLNPAPTDATQRMIFAWMPWVFMFMLGQFAAGLVIYWTANNIITFTQQYLIMRSQGVRVNILGNITSGFKKGSSGEAGKK